LPTLTVICLSNETAAFDHNRTGGTSTSHGYIALLLPLFAVIAAIVAICHRQTVVIFAGDKLPALPHFRHIAISLHRRSAGYRRRKPAAIAKSCQLSLSLAICYIIR
jgi:hypothetical protein